jgi:hypothetical protein
LSENNGNSTDFSLIGLLQLDSNTDCVVAGIGKGMDFCPSGMGFLSYSERLQKLGLTTLLERRMRVDLIEAYKIINGHVNYGHQMFNHNLHYSTRNICNISSCRTRFVLNRFNVRISKYWNNLPNSVKYAPSVNAFKAGHDYLKSYNPDSRHGYWYLSQEIFN